MSDKTKELLFVYGTLRRDHQNNMYRLLARYATFKTEAWYQGRLYLVSHYPGAVPSEHSSEKVFGEVYELTAPEIILPQLDEYEECSEHFVAPTEYVRQRVGLTSIHNEALTAWMYVYNLPVEPLALIPSGDFYKR